MERQVNKGFLFIGKDGRAWDYLNLSWTQPIDAPVMNKEITTALVDLSKDMIMYYPLERTKLIQVTKTIDFDISKEYNHANLSML